MTPSRKAALALIGLVFGCASQPLLLRDAGSDRSQVIRIDSNLVLVPVTVTDNRGTPVEGLTTADFVLKEERARQTVVSVSRENAAVSLGVVFDLSGSMAAKMVKARAALKEFLNNLEVDDEMFLVTFADRPELRIPFTSESAAIQDAIWTSRAVGSTALYDAIALAMSEMHRAQKPRKVLFLVSDGGDNHSRLTERELRRLVEEEDVQIHAIGIHDSSDRMDEARGPWILEDLAKMTGGQHHMVTNIGDLPQLAAKMSLGLHEYYLLGYRPTPPGPSGTFRRIDVQVVPGASRPRAWVYARKGYRMP